MEDALYHLRAADPILAAIIERVGPCRVVPREPTFETLARSIVYQQLSGKAAATIFARLKKAAGRRLTASAFLRLGVEELRNCGLSRQKIAAVTDLAEHVQSRKIRFGRLASLTDDEVIELLSAVRGVGVWTAQMFLMFALERPNIMPLSDLGIRSAVRKAYGLSALPDREELLALSAKWHPHCTIACWYLWRSLEGPAELA